MSPNFFTLVYLYPLVIFVYKHAPTRYTLFERQIFWVIIFVDNVIQCCIIVFIDIDLGDPTRVLFVAEHLHDLITHRNLWIWICGLQDLKRCMCMWTYQHVCMYVRAQYIVCNK